ncbi:MAG TPA: pentapeptide repeat-containing protein [Elainellaceae cyanobacterium]
MSRFCFDSLKRLRLRYGGLSVKLWRLLALWIILIGAIATSLGYAPSACAENYDKQSLIDVDFSGQDLTDSSFTKANLRSSDLSDTNLRGVSFFGANLEGATLTGADLSYATLDTARFVNANLTNAILEGAFAFNTKFDGATIIGADFTEVLLRRDMQEKLCKVAQGNNPITKRSTKDTLEC